MTHDEIGEVALALFLLFSLTLTGCAAAFALRKVQR